jgi:hypothetical protein
MIFICIFILLITILAYVWFFIIVDGQFDLCWRILALWPTLQSLIFLYAILSGNIIIK